MTSSSIVKHNFSNQPPEPREVSVGEVVLQLSQEQASLYTKTPTGHIIQIGKGVEKFEELEDVDLTNLKEGSFLVRQGDKFVASNFLGSIGNLSDVELSNPQNGDYLRYDNTFLSFRNFRPSYNLFQITDVDVPNPTTNQAAAQAVNDHLLYYDHPSGKFKLRPRRTLLNELDDVTITSPQYNQLLQLDTDGVWKNMDLQIVRDPSPALGGNLDASGFALTNSTYKVVNVLCNEPIKNISYTSGDYFILQGVSASVNEQCIVVIDVPFNPSVTTAVAVLMLEIRQNTGNILLAGLQNIQYEDGKLVKLSGNGKVDLLTITVKKIGTTITTYVTATALNMASVGAGGTPSYRYDKNRYPDVQVFGVPKLYDDFFDYVSLLLNFEPEESTGKLWYEDKSDLSLPVTTTTTNLPIDSYTYGRQEYVASFNSSTNNITINTTEDLILTTFTFECFIRFPETVQYAVENMEHVLFTNNSGTFSIKYVGDFNITEQTTSLQITLFDNTYTFPNAYNYFRDKNNKYVHIALVRDTTNSLIRFYIDGILQVPVVALGSVNSFNSITITNALITGFVGLLNTVRITNLVRYTTNFQIPDMRFGLVGGASDILDAQVFDLYMYLGEKELEFDIFC